MLCIKVMRITGTENAIFIAKTKSATCITEAETANCITKTETATCIITTETVTCINKISEYLSWVGWVHFSQIILSI